MTQHTNQFLQLFQLIQDPCILVRIDGRNFILEALNDAYKEVFKGRGKQMAALSGKQWHKEPLLSALFPVERLREVRDLAAERRYEQVIDGVLEYQVEYLPLKNEQEDISHIIIRCKKPQRLPSTHYPLQHQEQFRILVQEGTELLTILDIQGNFKFLNEATKKLFGNSPEDFIGTSAFKRLHPDDAKRVMKDFKRTESCQQVKIAPFRVKKEKGSWIWIETTAINMLSNPAVHGIITSSRDITRTIEQAREIENLNERYRLAATATQDVMYDWDIFKNQVIKFHRNLTDLLGYPVEEIEQDDFWSNQIHPQDYPVEVSKRKRILADPSQTFIRSEYRFKREDGTYAKVIDRGFILRNKMGKAVRMVGALKDISDITAKEEALKTANKRFNMALEATNEMVWDWDIASDTVLRSKTFHKIFGYNVEQHTSMENFWLTKIVADDKPRIQRSLNAALSDPSRNVWKEEYRFLRANGEVSFIVDRGFIIRDDHGQAQRMVGAVLDVSDSTRLINKIKQQNRILRQIAWEQSHIVRAPIARMKSLLKFMEMEIFDEMSQEEIWEQIMASTEELDDIVKNIVQKTEEMHVEEAEEPSLLNL